MFDLDTFLRLADLAISLAVLAFMLIGFVRGDILSRRSVEEIVALTTETVLERLGVS